MNRVNDTYSAGEPDRGDLKYLFEEYYDRLAFFSWQIVNNQQQAEDLTQEAFISYWEQRSQVSNHPVAIKNFLYRTVRNASLNVVRHKMVIGKFEASQSSVEPSESYIIEALISAEVTAELNAALSTLSPQLQIISRLSFLEGKKVQEVADELHMSPNTVKKQKKRALELLRIRLNPEIIIILTGFGSFFY